MLGILIRSEELKDINIIEYKQIFETIDKRKTLLSDNRNRITRSITKTNEITLE